MEDIIRLFASNETTFDHYETVLADLLSFVSSEEENGIFSFEATSPLDDRIVEGKIIKAPTARGEQLFRIIRVKKVIPGNYLYIYGRHITYDLLNNFILNIRPTNTTQANALSAILGGTETAHTFTSTSDVPGINTANYVRMNPIQAIMGNQSNSALNLWGGYLRRDNFEFKVLATSPDKGYEIRFGKNLIGIEEELNMTEVVTRFYPTVVIEEPTVTALPEKYVDSPLIANYPEPIIKELRIDLTDDEKLLPIADIYQLMRDRCNEQFTLKADLPKMNYKIDFVQLRKTEQYKHLAILEELDISDTVWAYVDPLNLSMSARMIKYTHDGLNDRFMSMELGNFKAKLTNQKAEFTKLVETATKELTDGTITTMLKNAVDTIQGNLGGNVVTITVDGKPVAMAFMDTDDVNTANEYVIINDQGIAFGKNGLNNPPEVAIDISGNVVATSGFFDSITTNLIQSDIGNDLVLSSNTSIKLLANSLVTVDENGITVGTDGSTIVSRQSYDGFRVLDGDDVTASMVGGIASIPELYSDRIHGDVINTHPGGTVSIGTGKDFTTINEALQAIGSRKHLLGDLVFNVYNTIIEDITIRGFSGGMIYIRLVGGAIHGDVNFYQNSAGGYLLGVGERGLVKGSIRFTGGNGYVQSLIVDPEDLTSTGIVSEYGSQVFITNCDIVNAKFAVLAQHGGTIMALNNIGEIGGGQPVYNTYNGGVLYARGTMPLGTPKFGGTTTAFQYDFTTTQESSEYDPPTEIPTLMSQTFSPTKLETYSYQYDAISSYYPGRAAQNRWDTGTSHFEGRITFGGAVRNYINDRNGDAGLKVELQVRRYSGTNGAWSGVAPDKQFAITGGSFGAVEKGAWSGWVTLSPTLIPTSGYTFKFGSQSTGDKYAVWDGAKIRVTKTKNI